MRCLACDFENRALARYCGRCGVTLRHAVLCAACSSENPSIHVFCDVCGGRLTVTADVSTAESRQRAATTERRAESEHASERASVRTQHPDAAHTATPPPPAESPANGHAAAHPANRDAEPQPPDDNAAAEPDTDEPSLDLSRPHVPDGVARVLAATGALAALIGSIYLQLGTPSNWTKAGGLGLLVVGAALFGVAARTAFLRPVRQWASRDRFPLQSVFAPGPPALAAGTGTIVFAVLLGRLWSGSTAATDLLLWVIALASFTMALVGRVPRWQPTRQQMWEVGAVTALTLVFVGLNARDLNDWYYSAIGDEYAFLAAASGVLADGIRKPFSQDGVYGAHPVLGTLFQAAVMRVLGNNHFGWIFSSVLSAALAIPALYLIGRALGGPAVGFAAAALFGFNHYLFAFAHLGYNNVMAPAPTAWAIALFMLSWRRPSIGLLYACGVVAGLGFYTFYSARTAIPIIGLFLILHASWRENLSWRHWREQILRFWPIALGLVLAAGPIFAASGSTVILRMFNEVPGGYDSSVTGPPGQKILANFWLNVPAYFYNTHVAHYISGSLLDPVSGVLAVLGVGLAWRWWDHRGVKLVSVWALVAISTTALLSPHPTTAVTRLLFGVAPLAVLGALAARQVWELLTAARETPPPVQAGAAAVAVLLVVVLGLNAYRFWYVTPTRYHLTNDAVVVGALRSPLCRNDPARAIVVMRGHGLLRGALTSYRPERDLPRFVTHESLQPGQVIPLDGAHCVVFGHPEDEPAKRALADLLRSVPGSMVSPFRDPAGIGTVMVFTPTQQ